MSQQFKANTVCSNLTAKLFRSMLLTRNKLSPLLTVTNAKYVEVSCDS